MIYDDVRKMWVRLGGRKFGIVAVATVALFLGKLGGTEWATVACLYFAANAVNKKVVKPIEKQED